MGALAGGIRCNLIPNPIVQEEDLGDWGVGALAGGMGYDPTPKLLCRRRTWATGVWAR